jgi:predicted phage-related endonuclease
MKLFKVESGSQHWLNLRLKAITGTEIATLFGLSKYLFLPKLQLKKKGGVDEFPDNSILRTGRMMEHVAAASARELGFNIQNASSELNTTTYITTDCGMLSASLDFFYYDNDMKLGIAECKSSELDKKFKDWKEGILPEHYLLQIQTQLGIYGLEKGILIFTHSKAPFPTVIYEIEKNNEIFDIMLLTAKDFWCKIYTDEKITTNKEGKKRILEILPNTFKKISESWVEDVYDTKDKGNNNNNNDGIWG